MNNTALVEQLVGALELAQEAMQDSHNLDWKTGGYLNKEHQAIHNAALTAAKQALHGGGVDWAEVGRLLEAVNSARAAGFMVGTSNWGAHVCKAMLSASPTTPAQPVDQVLLEALKHARKVLNHNNLALECVPINAAIAQATQPGAGLTDGERYQMVRRGQHWSVINGIGDVLRGEELDQAIEAAHGIQKGQQS